MTSDVSDQMAASIANALLPRLPRKKLEAIYLAAPGDEIRTGKFAHPESSAALVANVFGFFLDRSVDLPDFLNLSEVTWPATELALEAVIRLPWPGGRHPCLDLTIRTSDALVGVESKRYEPFRPKWTTRQSSAYKRAVWGECMSGYIEAMELATTTDGAFSRLDVPQLVKHALALRTQIHRAEDQDRVGVLCYLHAEPEHWPDGRLVSHALREQHRSEIQRFSDLVAGCEVRFTSATYESVLDSWRHSEMPELTAHADAVAAWLQIREPTMVTPRER